MIRPAVPSRAALVLVALAMVLAACGSTPAASDPSVSPTVDHSDMASMDHSPSASASASAAASPSAGATDGGDTGAVEVQVNASSFSPGLLTVAVGTEVTFVNSSGLPHTVTHGSNGRPVDDPAFDQPVSDGGSVTITFDEAGSFDITCKIHPTMNMTVVVEG